MTNETPTGQVVLSFPIDGPAMVDHDITCLNWSPSGALLATGSLDAHVRIYTESGQQCATLLGHKDHVFAVQFSPIGDLLLSAGADHAAVVWKVDTCQVVQSFAFHRDTVLAVAWKNGQCFATGSADGDVGLCTIGRGFQVLKGHKGHVNAIAYNASGALLASASEDATVRLWGASGCDVLTPHYGGVTQVEWAGENIVVAGSMNGQIRMWDAGRRECLRVLDHDQQGLICMAMSPGASLVVTGSQDQKIVVSRIADGEKVVTFTGNSDVYDVAWDPTGRFVSACFDDSTVAIIPIGNYLR
jgi:WD40 repeat protein